MEDEEPIRARGSPVLLPSASVASVRAKELTDGAKSVSAT
jgi:hypothetical protein